MISRLLILSPHGYFGQDNVLGLPDTGGQVVYILDQVRALEKEMHDRLQLQGVQVEPKILIVTRLIPDAGDTTCNQRLEKSAAVPIPGFCVFRFASTTERSFLTGFRALKYGLISKFCR